LLDALDRLPQTFAHQDTVRSNLLGRTTDADISKACAMSAGPAPSVLRGSGT
jgi:hypothetical protein